MHSKFSIYLEAFSRKSYSIHGIIPARNNVQPLEHERIGLLVIVNLEESWGKVFPLVETFPPAGDLPPFVLSLFLWPGDAEELCNDV